VIAERILRYALTIQLYNQLQVLDQNSWTTTSLVLPEDLFQNNIIAIYNWNVTALILNVQIIEHSVGWLGNLELL
jgi:hypothetical protein